MGAPSPGPPPVFPSVVAAHTDPLYSGQRGYLIQQIIAELHTRGFTDDQIYRQGLRVTTTFDPHLEAVPTADATQGDHDLEVGLAAVRPGTGEVLASYGGRNYLSHEYDNAFLMADSYNTVFARLAATAARVGLGKPSRSLGLGTGPAVTAVDQAAAYAAFAGGDYAAPHVVHEVRDIAGQLLTRVTGRPRQVFSAKAAALVKLAMHAPSTPANPAGTGSARTPRTGLASQAGTTTSNAAGWFCAVDPGVTVSVLAYRDSNRPLANSGDVANLRNTKVPTQIGRSFMNTAAASPIP